MLCVEHAKSAHWLLRWQRDGRVRHMGLGSAFDLPLAAAREVAREQRERIARGVDPLEVRRKDREAQREATAGRMTFRLAAQRCFEAAAPGWSNAQHAGEFLASLERYAFPILASLDVASIGKDEILRVLEQPIRDRIRGESGSTFWNKRSQTADRTRRRIEQVLDFATVRGWRSGDNPARWKSFLDQVLARPRAIAPIRNMRAVAYAEVPAVMTALAADQGVAAQCLRFIVLVAARLSEAVKATYDEIDFKAAEWRVPKERMKARRAHVVPLSPQALELLRGIYREQGNPYIFVSPRTPGAHVAASAIGDALRRAKCAATIHGFRSSFRDWCGDHTEFPREVAEAALAHVVGDQAEQAYRRGSALEKRRQLMTAWAGYCCSPPAKVVPLRKEALA
jgi:integrase